MNRMNRMIRMIRMIRSSKDFFVITKNKDRQIIVNKRGSKTVNKNNEVDTVDDVY
jgi:hypothetical protein